MFNWHVECADLLEGYSNEKARERADQGGAENHDFSESGGFDREAYRRPGIYPPSNEVAGDRLPAGAGLEDVAA